MRTLPACLLCLIFHPALRRQTGNVHWSAEGYRIKTFRRSIRGPPTWTYPSGSPEPDSDLIYKFDPYHLRIISKSGQKLGKSGPNQVLGEGGQGQSSRSS